MLPVKLSPLGINVKRLPYDREVEYLESTGTQWIDTGVLFVFSKNYSIIVNVANLTSSRSIIASTFGGDTTSGVASLEFGGTQNNQPYKPRAYFSTNIADVSSWGQEVPINSICNLILTYSNQRTATFTVNSTKKYNIAIPTGTPQTQTSFLLYKDRRADSSSLKNTIRIYSASFSIDSEIARDFIPVRTTIEGKRVGAMYDRANPNGGPNGNGMYYNQGSGDFIIGPDL